MDKWLQLQFRIGFNKFPMLYPPELFYSMYTKICQLQLHYLFVVNNADKSMARDIVNSLGQCPPGFVWDEHIRWGVKEDPVEHYTKYMEREIVIGRSADGVMKYFCIIEQNSVICLCGKVIPHFSLLLFMWHRIFTPFGQCLIHYV